jgi:uncharacterized protein
MASQLKRGFGAMDPERQRAIARRGGSAVPQEKRSFSQNRGLAVQAGRKGGASVPQEKRSFSQDRQLAADAGRKGGASVPHEKRSFSQDRQLAASAGRRGGEARQSDTDDDTGTTQAASNDVDLQELLTRR